MTVDAVLDANLFVRNFRSSAGYFLFRLPNYYTAVIGYRIGIRLSMSHLWRSIILGFLFAATTSGVAPVFGQSIDVGGRMYADYFYNVAGPDSVGSSSARETLHGFRFRRLYLTTDFTLSEAFTGRARLEADEGTEGRPVVKDVSLTWTYVGDHSATLGITPPPAFRVVEDVWGYRSLEKTIMDVQDIVDSRDFGLRFEGPIAGDGTVRYAAMVANDGTVQPETNKDKRIYGQLQLRPTERLLFVAGGDYAGYNDERDAGTRLSVFSAYSTDRIRVGVEGYWYRAVLAEGGTFADAGASVLGVLQVASDWDLVARLDRSWEERFGPNQYDTLFLGAVAYRPHPGVALIPNLRLYDRDEAPAETAVRMTVEVNF